jgi:hypothetical protein
MSANGVDQIIEVAEMMRGLGPGTGQGAAVEAVVGPIS